ncbi:hypothetical protein HU200_067109 [Digitaria exilis]|uniref:K-box domain-containing protein n=1 Tax=Digitaria exilis TaxID=1010633 RepID=A0A835DWJ6_9POAL|nr:hypothetical protein HU200_067109 [Digitaria exilis]
MDVNSHQYFQQEAAKLQQQIQTLQNSNRHLMGESIGNLTAKELKSIETRLERGIGRIRSKKHELLLADIEYMQKREADLQSENLFLRAKVAEVERVAQEAEENQTMAAPPLPVAAGGGTAAELQALPASLDPRGYYLQMQASMLAASAASSSSQYPEEHPQGQEQHLQTALHLGYHIKVDSGTASKAFL